MKPIQQVNSVPESTQLNGTTDNSVKQPKSSNKKKSAKSAVSVESVNSVDNTNQVTLMQSPQLFTDEIGIADEAKSATQSDKMGATYARYQSCVANILTQSDRTDESNKSVEPSDTDLSDATVESTAPALPSAADSTIAVITPSVTTATVQPDTSDAPDEAKASRVSRKQSREELDSYKAAYLAPFKIGKRHTVVLDDDLWNVSSSSQDENYRKARRAFLVGYDRSVPKLRQASHCVGCKQCNPHCPQRIDIPREMRRIDKYVEDLKQEREF